MKVTPCGHEIIWVRGVRVFGMHVGNKPPFIMKFNREYLKSLHQLSVYDVKAKVKEDFNFDCSFHHCGAILPAIARPNTVLIFHENEFVIHASAGDPVQLE